MFWTIHFYCLSFQTVDLLVHDPQHHLPKFFKTNFDFGTKSWVILFWDMWWNFVWKFHVVGEVNGNVTWKLGKVVTTQNKTISNISMIFSPYFSYCFNFFTVDEFFGWKLASYASLKVHNMIHRIISHLFQTYCEKICHIFLRYLLKWGVKIPCSFGEINVNDAWK